MSILIIAAILTWFLQAILSTNAAGTVVVFFLSLFVVSATATSA